MGKSRKIVSERHDSLKLKVLVGKLRNSFFLCLSLNEGKTGGEVCREWAYEVPADVKEGYFAVSIIDGGTPKMFVMALGYLNHPEFVKLLDKAEEEFGFEEQGALMCLVWPVISSRSWPIVEKVNMVIVNGNGR